MRAALGGPAASPLERWVANPKVRARARSQRATPRGSTRNTSQDVERRITAGVPCPDAAAATRHGEICSMPTCLRPTHFVGQSPLATPRRRAMCTVRDGSRRDRGGLADVRDEGARRNGKVARRGSLAPHDLVRIPSRYPQARGVAGQMKAVARIVLARQPTCVAGGGYGERSSNSAFAGFATCRCPSRDDDAAT